jgi:predicted O-linked N-acetylglucosamine transferase (SPINDLY family)
MLEHRRAKAIYLQRRYRFDEAVEANQAILEKSPDDLETLLRIGHMLGYSLRRYEEANDYLRRAVALRPNDQRTLSGLCKSLLDSRYGVESDHVDEAGQVALKLLEVADDLRPLAANLTGVFLRLVDFDSLDKLGDKGELMSFWVDRMNVGSLHNQLGRVETEADRHALVDWHREWGRRIQRQVAKTPIKRARSNRKQDKIRVGFLSSDLRNHPVAYFALPIFERFDAEDFELFVYSFYPGEPDTVQAFVQKRCTAHRSMLQATDPEIAQRIADDQLDILFELGGSTRYNRLEVMAYQPAPVQVSWLGYPHSCGLPTIDRILVDPYLMPEDPKLLIEQPFMVPESWVVLGKLGFRDISIEPGLPEERNGFFTFGTMNNPYKYTRDTFEMWARAMQGVPDSRFLFVRPEAGAPTFRANVEREFAKHGVAPERILYESVRGRHLPHYNRIDLALDTAPQTGGTTTCETLWMGVPVVSLIGPAFFERLSYSNLTNAGLGDLCARSADDYVAIAVRIAADRHRRAELRTGLREQIRAHPLGDEERWVRNFENVIRTTVGAEAVAAG